MIIGAKPSAFISFDVEALPGRADSDHVDRLIWGKFGNSQFGIGRICNVLNQHKIKGNFLIDIASCVLYGDKVVKEIGHYLLDQGHELHVHLHSEWLIRNWNLDGPQFNGPAGLDQLDSYLNNGFLEYAAFKYAQLFKQEPILFRAGGYKFNAHTVKAAHAAGFKALSNFNFERHFDIWDVPFEHENNEPFLWPDGIIEIPVDYSPEPLSTPLSAYMGYFDRVLARKNINKTFNLTLHSWSLLKRDGEFFTGYAPEHEDRLHAICEHLVCNTNVAGYTDYLTQLHNLPVLGNTHCLSEGVSVKSINQCSICKAIDGKEWVNDICPSCGARARHRQLKDVLNRINNPLDGCLVLSCYANSIEKLAFLSQAHEVVNFDVRPVGEVDFQMDIQDMSRIADESFDAFLAIHVLNHVADDRKALSEIHRVLMPGGIAFLTIPYREASETTAYENVTEHYGADSFEKYGVGSYRRYGLQDALSLFSEFFSVQAEDGYDAVTQQRMKVFILSKA